MFSGGKKGNNVSDLHFSTAVSCRCCNNIPGSRVEYHIAAEVTYASYESRRSTRRPVVVRVKCRLGRR